MPCMAQPDRSNAATNILTPAFRLDTHKPKLFLGVIAKPLHCAGNPSVARIVSVYADADPSSVGQVHRTDIGPAASGRMFKSGKAGLASGYKSQGKHKGRCRVIGRRSRLLGQDRVPFMAHMRGDPSLRGCCARPKREEAQ